jgi:hypothetical protein
MSRQTHSSRLRVGAAALAAVMAIGAPLLQAHHSFAPFDMNKVRLYTGVVTRVNPDANHLQIYFALMNDERKNVVRGADGKPVIWEVEMAGSAAAAAEGISVATFAPGTVFSGGMRPSRNGDPKGLREGALFKCPAGANGKPQPPQAGKHCDSVEGRVAIPTTGRLSTPTAD